MPTIGWRDRAYDAIVVGARCAGASTAMLLARAGLSVLAIDRSPEGSDTLSTHALMRGAVLRLSRWGLLSDLEAAATPAIRSTTFHYGDESLAIPIKPRDGLDALYAPRRTVLDPMLVAAARAAGAQVVHGVRVADVLADSTGRVRGVAITDREGETTTLEAGIVIGADGLQSRVAHLVGAPVEHAGHHASATVYGYLPSHGLDGYHWYYRPGVSAGVIPTNGGLAAVFVTLPRERYDRERPGGLDPMFRGGLNEVAPELARRLAAEASRDPSSAAGPRLRAFAGERGFLRRASGPGWALVGDAGAFRDPITAHGITDALRDAGWLAEAVARGTDRALADYQARRDDAALDLMRLSDEIAGFGWGLERVRELHLGLSRLMAREAEVMASDRGAILVAPA